MVDQILWRLGGVVLFLCFIFLVFFFVSFLVHSKTGGRVYQQFKEQPRRFLVGSVVASVIYGLVSMMFDFSNILLSPLMIEPIDIEQSIVFALIQCLLVLIIGPLVIWSSFRLAIPLAHKLLHRSDSLNR